VRRRPSVAPTVEEPEPSFREDLAALWRAPPKVKLMILAAAMLILPVAFLAGFFLFGGWVGFEDHLPAWVRRLFIALAVIAIAWSLVSRSLNRLERRSKERTRR
jgi:Kef-type K+ transport system membrane component KefB